MTLQRLPLPGWLAYRLGYPQVGHLPEKRQQGLRAFWLDGLFASLSGGFADPYYTLYLLSLSASNTQIGLVSTLSQLAGAALALPGATIADRTGHYRRLSLLCGVASRLLWIVMLTAPWLLDDSGAVWLIVVALIGIAGVGALGSAAWTALSADLVPVRLRGGYFASRNIVSQSVRLMAIPTAGYLVNLIGEPRGYQVNLMIAFTIGLLSLYYYSRLPEHLPSTDTEHLGTRELVRRFARIPTFKRFVVSHATLMLGVMIGGPFFNVYMVQEAGFNTGTIGMVTTVSVLASLVGMRILGRWQDRFGMTWTMRFGLGVPLVPVAYLWIQHPWQAYLISALAALTWAGYNLGSFNLLLASTPNEHRPRYIAIHTTITSIVGAVGPLLGGWLLDATGFMPVFSLSSIMRALGLILFLALVREPDAPPDVVEEAGEDEQK